MSFHSKSPKESKSTNGSSKNLAKLSKSAKNNSDQNTPSSKLVQKSIFKLPSCSTYFPHQNPIKIEPKTMQNRPQKLKNKFGRKTLKCNKNSHKKRREKTEITSGECPGRWRRERDERERESSERELRERESSV